MFDAVLLVSLFSLNHFIPTFPMEMAAKAEGLKDLKHLTAFSNLSSAGSTPRQDQARSEM